MFDNELAYNYGEWQGKIPAHWYSSKMILKPYERKNAYDGKKIIIFLIFKHSKFNKYSKRKIYKKKIYLKIFSFLE